MSKFLLTTLIFSTISLLSCNKAKEKESPLTPEKVISETALNSSADGLFNNTIKETEEVVADANRQSFQITTIKSVTEDSPSKQITIDHRDLSTFPKTITVEYTNWLTNGHLKNGSVIIIITAPIGTVNATRTVSFSDFTVNGYAIDGNITHEYLGKIDNIPTSEVILTAGSITSLTNNTTVLRSFQHLRKWVEGSNTLFNFWDDRFEISGTGTGTTATGISFTSQITLPLEISTTCPWIHKGTIATTYEEKLIATIDYGDGTCDKKYTITINGIKTQFELSEAAK